jgi:hypothetical protein
MYRRTTFLLFSLCLAAILSAAGCKSNVTQASPEKSNVSQTLEGAALESDAALAGVVAQPIEEGVAAQEKGEVVQAPGRVRLVGSGFSPELVISGEGKQWYVAKEDMQKLNHLQHQTVTVEGEETIRELRWANGRPAGKRRYLRNIKIINAE